MKKSGRAAFLLEEGRLTAAAGEEECWCFPVSAQTSLLDGEGEAAEAYLAAFLPVFLDEEIEKTLFDVKQAMHRLAPLEEGAEGLPIQNAGFDLMIAAYLLHPLRSRYEVGELCEARGPAKKRRVALFAARAHGSAHGGAGPHNAVYDHRNAACWRAVFHGTGGLFGGRADAQRTGRALFGRYCPDRAGDLQPGRRNLQHSFAQAAGGCFV